MSKILDWDIFINAWKNTPETFKKLLNSQTKEAIYSLIKKASRESEYFDLLFSCLNKKTALGARFWRQEGIFSCGIEKGFLQKICQLLENSLTAKIDSRQTSVDELFHLYCKRGDIYSLQREKRKAIKDYERAEYCQQAVSEADRASLYYTLAKKYQALGENFFQDSLRCYGVAMQLNSNASKIFRDYEKVLEESSKENLFNGIMQIKDFNQQLFLLKEAINPNTSLGKRFWRQEGLFSCDFKKGYLRKICAELEKIYQAKADANDERVESLVLLGDLYNAQGFYDLAIKVFEVPEIAKNGYVISQRGCARYHLGNFVAAADDYNILLNRNPLNASTHKKLAMVYSKTFESNSGFFNKDPVNLAKAIYHYLQTEPLDLAEQADSKVFSDLLRSHSKQTIFAAVKFSQNTVWEIPLDNALSQTTTLGQRFWNQEGMLPCSLEAGTLKAIKDLASRTAGPSDADHDIIANSKSDIIIIK